MSRRFIFNSMDDCEPRAIGRCSFSLDMGSFAHQSTMPPIQVVGCEPPLCRRLGAKPAPKAIIGRGTRAGLGVKGAAAIVTGLFGVGIGGHDGVILNNHIHREIGLTGITGCIDCGAQGAVKRGNRGNPSNPPFFPG